ncbi:MAG: transposase [Verrucomicrobiae bacterium]|jgi:transposase|nr:transposase [Verrucomicrobiae bacterium]
MPNSRRKYDEEFRRRAVRLSYSSERSVKATAESLGINTNMLHRWRNQYTPDGDKTQMAEQDDELRKLRYRIAELEEENDILKKASAFFARNQK